MKKMKDDALDNEVSAVLKMICGAVAIFLAASAAVGFCNMGACGVAQRTLDADNIIFNYEQ
jgi:hypothetical protein